MMVITSFLIIKFKRFIIFIIHLDRDPIDESRQYKIAYTNTFGKPPWFDPVAREYAACRETIGLSDYSSFTKIDLWVIKIILELNNFINYVQDSIQFISIYFHSLMEQK